MNFRNLKEKRMKTIHKKNTTFLNLAATALMVAALVLGCNTNVSNGGEVQPPVTDGCTVTMSAGANGSITASPVIPAGGKVAKDAEITFTATANTGYRVDTWTVTPAKALIADGQQGDATAKVKVTANTIVNVTFKAIKYPVTMTHGEHGDITADMSIPAEGIDYGTEITFTATANPGYRVDTWTVTPAEALIPDGQHGDTTAKVKVTANTTVNVTFKPIVYTPVAYADLHNHLTDTQPESDGIYYIEVTGLTAPDVEGYFNGASPLGQILNSNGQKKVALKFGTMPYVTDMRSCFSGCTSLVQVSDIPNSVTNMSFCFSGCTKLEQVPNIPNSVTDMSRCFNGCTSLTSVTLKCGYLDGKFNYAFYGCSRLSAGSIKVPADSLDDYKNKADKMKAKAEWFAKDE